MNVFVHMVKKITSYAKLKKYFNENIWNMTFSVFLSINTAFTIGDINIVLSKWIWCFDVDNSITFRNHLKQSSYFAESAFFSFKAFQTHEVQQYFKVRKWQQSFIYKQKMVKW